VATIFLLEIGMSFKSLSHTDSRVTCYATCSSSAIYQRGASSMNLIISSSECDTIALSHDDVLKGGTGDDFIVGGQGNDHAL
jgi:hypothetical protein